MKCGVSTINTYENQMKRKITLIIGGLFLGILNAQAQTTSCPDDRVAYVDSKNVGNTGAYTLSIDAEEKASQTYHYSGQGTVGGARIYGTVPLYLGITLRISLYNVDANGRPTGMSLATAPLANLYPWSAPSFDVSFSPAVLVSGDFAIVVEIVNLPGKGHNFALKYTGNGEGLGEDLASLAGTSTGFNWASTLSDFGRDGDFYMYPRMINFNTPLFSFQTPCININTPISFTNQTQITNSPMFNKIMAQGYAGSNFLYTWNFGDGSAVSHELNPIHTYTNAGSYSVTLTSTIEGWDGACTKTVSKMLSVGLSANTTSVVNVTCNGGNNGSVISVGTGGVSPYSYSLNGDTYQATAIFSGLVAGTYTLTVKDNIGCKQTSNFTITQPAAIHFSIPTSTNASCGNADGGITVTASGGVSPLQYRLNTGTYQSNGVFTGLEAGGYTITAKDVTGCVFSSIFSVNNLGGPSFGITNSTNVSCYGGNDGSINLSSIGGTGIVQYSINGGVTYQNSGIFAHVTAGTYTAMVKDAAGCTEVKVFYINQPSYFTLSAVNTGLSCFESHDGQIDVTHFTGGTGVPVFSLDGINFQSGLNFSGLTAGTYTVYGKDIAGCVTSIQQTVTMPTALTATIAATGATCHSYQNGTILVTGNGGTPSYAYSLGSNSAYQNVALFNNLAAGTYPVYVTDVNGCVFLTSASIGQPNAILPNSISTNSTCGNSNGGFLASATGGSGSGFVYCLNGGTFGNGSFTSLAAGLYIITAKDGTGCSQSINSTIFDSNGPSILTSSNTNVNCNGGNDGTITVGNVTGGTGALLYSINGTIYQTSNVFTGLFAGVYNVMVKDAVGCIGNTTKTVTEPNAFAINTTFVNAICNGSFTGSITVLVGGGNGTLAYSINGGSSYQSSSTFNNLSAGTYTIIVKDAGGCLGYVSRTISQPSIISAFYSSLNVACYGENTGAINIYANGGTGSLQYNLNGGSFQTSNVFTGLFGGVYFIVIKDALGCTKTIQINVHEASEIIIDANVTDVSCGGGNNGVIDISISGGNTNYNFSWSNGLTTEDIFNLVAGTYDVMVMDGNGCSSTHAYTVSQPADPVIVNGTVVNSTGTNNGSISIAVTGGVGNYTYEWSNSATTANLTGLNPGVYTVIITDANGCSASNTFIVSSIVNISEIDLIGEKVILYPNPTTQFVIIETEGLMIEKTAIFDVFGKLIFSNQDQKSKIEINTSNFNPGVYFVQILVEGKLITKSMSVLK